MLNADSRDVSRAAGPGGDFTVGDWLVEPTLNRVSRNGTTVHLRPQLVDVLVCLSGSPGRPVSRHELLDRVWPKQFVADTALARCVAELRQALGDRASSPTIIETIPKRGYRLIAPVTPAAGNDHGGNRSVEKVTDSLSAATEPPAAEAPGVTNAPDVLAAPGAIPAPAPATAEDTDSRLTGLDGPQDDIAALVRPAPVRAAIRRLLGADLAHGWRMIASVLGAAAIGMLVTWWGLRPAVPARPPLAERDPVVLSFTNATGDPVFDDALRLALAIHLEQSPYVRIVPDRAVQESLAFLGQPAASPVSAEIAMQVCDRTGAAAVLQGSIASLGQRYVIGLEAVACASRETIARAQAEAGTKEGVLGALSQAANAIRRDLGESMASIARFDVSLGQARTPPRPPPTSGTRTGGPERRERPSA